MVTADFPQIDTIILYALEGQYVEIVLQASSAQTKVTRKGSSSISAKSSGNVSSFFSFSSIIMDCTVCRSSQCLVHPPGYPC